MDSIDLVIGREPTELKWDDLTEKEKKFHLWLHFLLQSPEFQQAVNNG